MDSLAFVLAMAQIGAAIALLNGLLTTIGQSKIAVAAIEGIARQPEARGSITSTMFITLAVAETSGIYGLVIAMMLLLFNPLLGQYASYLIAAM